MGFKCGIIGLPNVGKSTMFNALTEQQVASENYPFCTIDPNVGVVPVPDSRLQQINECIAAQKIIPTTMEFVDIAGLVKGASKGEGLGNKFLSHIRETDAVAHVTRCFDDADITHVEGKIDPVRDVEIINAELAFADIETIQNAQRRFAKLAKQPTKETTAIVQMIAALEQHVQALKPARTFNLEAFLEQHRQPVLAAYRDMHLITAKRVLYVCNITEDDLLSGQDNKYVAAMRAYAQTEGAALVTVCVKLEQEINALPAEERQELLSSYHLKESSLAQLIRAGYQMLGLQTYFTAGEKEIRAWTIRLGDKAPEAAGKIHSDFQKGFICAEVYTVPDLLKARNKAALKAQGLLRIEGRDYIVQDGDVMEFRFNV